MTTRNNDPNPLDEEMQCGMKGCIGTVRYDENDDHYRCEACEFEMSYQDMKDCALFATHLLEQYPDLDPNDLDDE